MFLTETWLGQNNSTAVLIESTPPNFSFMSEARRDEELPFCLMTASNARKYPMESLTLLNMLLYSPNPPNPTNYRPPRYNAEFF